MIKFLKELRVASIMDEFTELCYESECILCQLTPQNWLDELTEFRAHLLFVESSWRGKDGLWKGIGNIPTDTLRGIVAYCKSHNIPTVFWNKEDPYSYYHYRPIAWMFDYIFTTDIDSIKYYKRDTGNENVFLLHFAAQPNIHNPIEKYQRENKVCFAGSYYPNHFERQIDFDNIMNSILQHHYDFDIYDRNYNVLNTKNKFPEQYFPYIKGTLSAREIDKAYKGYVYNLNINTIKESATMFARRVFELMASNTIVISNHSNGIATLFGNYVINSDDPEFIINKLEFLKSDKISYEKYRLFGLRNVLKQHLYEDRLAYLADIILDKNFYYELPKITVFSVVNSLQEWEAAYKNFKRQDYNNAHLIVFISQTIKINCTDSKISFVHLEEIDNYIKSLNPEEYIANFNPADYYGKNYLTDLALAFRFTDAEIICKKEYYKNVDNGKPILINAGKSYHFVQISEIRRSLFKAKYYSSATNDGELCGDRLFAIDPYNYCENFQGETLPLVDDLTENYPYIDILDICKQASFIKPAASVINNMLADEDFWLNLTNDFVSAKKTKDGDVRLRVYGNENRHEFLYGNILKIDRSKTYEFYMSAAFECKCFLSCHYLDANNKKISQQVLYNATLTPLYIPEEAVSVRIVVRLEGKGSAFIHEFKLYEKLGIDIDNSEVNLVEKRLDLKEIGNIKEDKALALRIINTALSRELQLLNKSSKQLKTQYTDIKLKQEKTERENKKLKNLKIIKIYNRIFGIKKKEAPPKNFNKNKASLINNGVSIIIPTYRKNEYLDDAIKSVLNQDYPSNKLEIIIAVNGEDVNYYHELKNKYASKTIKVVYTETKGANAGRKIGLDYVSLPYFTFLDDDDFFTKSYLNYMISGIQDDETNIVIGKLVDFDESGKLVTEDTYINRLLNTSGEGKTKNYLKLSSLFASFCGKLYRTTFFKKSFSIETNFQHTEDVIFWAENFNHISGNVYLCNTNTNESYCRRLTKGSLSRPIEDKKADFYITQRLIIINYLSNLLGSKNFSVEHKRFILKLIKAQNSIMEKYYKDLTDNQKVDACKEIFSNRCVFLNKSKISDRKAIAFCHNFSPFIDASAFVATKRLHEVDELEGQPLCWLVISQNMANIRSKDELFQDFYSYFQFDKLCSLPGGASFGAIEQCRFGYLAFKKVENMNDVEVIYSRAQFVGSHIAAWLYKLSHPNVKWYAEFSDPLVYGVDNKVRLIQVEGENSYLNDYFWFIEQFVYIYADRIIFTNKNQMNYMLGYNPQPENNESIRKKAIIKHHPILPEIYTHLIESNYDLDSDKINIGYFGTFYPNRNLEDMLQLLTNKNVVLHIFTPNSDKLKESYPNHENRIRYNETICNLEFLNLASKMDYLFLNDTNFVGEINPYLPSKYADYKVTNTRIIVKIVAGSVLSEMDDKQLIKCKFIDENFAKQLSKQNH